VHLLCSCLELWSCSYFFNEVSLECSVIHCYLPLDALPDGSLTIVICEKYFFLHRLVHGSTSLSVQFTVQPVTELKDGSDKKKT
jgi:hypothetical protein